MDRRRRLWIHALVLPAIAIVLALTWPAWSQEPGNAPKPGPHHGIFGSMEFRGNFRSVPQWVRVLAKIKHERSIYAACDKDARECPSSAVASWRAMVRRVKGLARREQMAEVNRFLNKWPYRTDIENYGVQDYWASPLQFLRRSGDCEDYAIIKYVTLRELGFPASALRIVVLRDTLRNVPHAVLAVYLENSILIMDSLFDKILPDTQFDSFYVPQYSVNEKSIWIHLMPIRPRRDQLGVTVR